MRWLVHELTHVAQYEAVGSQYLGEAIAAQNSSAKYNYGGPAGLVGKNLADFNREQQGDIVADAYVALVNGSINSDQQRMVTQAKNSQF
ncbi:MAG TPA: hypothetical protein ENJ82_01915 [Bacteroidetes bacterium]|nr:hypothetical protein [Bacteroidota bacterium]